MYIYQSGFNYYFCCHNNNVNMVLTSSNKIFIYKNIDHLVRIIQFLRLDYLLYRFDEGKKSQGNNHVKMSRNIFLSFSFSFSLNFIVLTNLLRITNPFFWAFWHEYYLILFNLLNSIYIYIYIYINSSFFFVKGKGEFSFHLLPKQKNDLWCNVFCLTNLHFLQQQIFGRK